MKKITLCALALLSLICYSQPTVKRTIAHDSGFKEEFNVLKANKDIRHGQYSMSLGKLIFKTGLYSNGERIGIWKYYSTSGLDFVYDFDKNKIVSDSIGIARPALYSEGEYCFLYSILEQLNYPEEARDDNIRDKLILQFRVDTIGKPDGFILVQGSGNLTLNNVVINAVKKIALENPWYPGINEKGEKIVTSISFPFSFSMR
jgi:TonB family protein